MYLGTKLKFMSAIAIQHTTLAFKLHDFSLKFVSVNLHDFMKLCG